jgi:hypothetical protein
MDFIVTDILSGELVPVLLGYSAETSETAQRMYRKYGVISHVFCDKRPLSMRLSLCIKAHTVKHTANEMLMMQALTDFSEQLGNKEVILYLIPCTEEYTRLLRTHAPLLESRYVLYGMEGATAEPRREESEGGAS